jgi:acetyl-CoA acetyltransferase
MTAFSPIAVVGWAQTPMLRRTELSETHLLVNAISAVLEPLGLTRADIDFTCLGSCDYITGQPFSFVQNLDALGAWPPKQDSHVEMDGAWALYEAWLRLQHGDIEIAVVTGSGRSSTGDPALIYPMEMDPYYLAPLGADPLTFAALQARALIAAGIVDERSMAEVAVRSRRDAVGNDYAQVSGEGDVDALLGADYVREPLRRHDLPPITDGACAMVLATADRARQLVDRPAWITGIDHRSECHNPAFRDLTDSPSTRIAAVAAGVDAAPIEVAELQAAFTHEELLLRRVLALGDGVKINPSGGALASNPIMATGLVRIGYAADHIFGGGSRALAHSTSGPCLQQNLVCVLEAEGRQVSTEAEGRQVSTEAEGRQAGTEADHE